MKTNTFKTVLPTAERQLQPKTQAHIERFRAILDRALAAGHKTFNSKEAKVAHLAAAHIYAYIATVDTFDASTDHIEIDIAKALNDLDDMVTAKISG